MKILLCAATKPELGTQLINSNHEIEFCITGVGLPQTAYSLSKKLAHSIPDLCIQIGIAGAFDKTLQLGDPVLVKRDCFADLGARDRDGSFLHLTGILSCDASNPFEQYYLEPAVPTHPMDFPLVNAISVNSVHGHQPEIDQVKAIYDPQIESMEGAAFFAVCLSAGIPCLQLRSISNYVQPRDRASWQIGLAITNLHLALSKILTGFE